jgi:uncharacterized lipoprotein YmbA
MLERVATGRTAAAAADAQRRGGHRRGCSRPRAGVVYGMLLVMALAGCAGTPPSTFYTLTPIPEAAGRAGDIAGGDIAVGLGPVVFPQFLDRPQIVTRGGTNRLVVDEFHRWGGTVQDDFLRVWGENLAYLLGTSRVALFPTESRTVLDFRVPAEVVAFEGAADGVAVLKVRWSVMDDRLRRTFTAREDVYRCPIGGAGVGGDTPADIAARNAAVVAAMSRCLGDFSRDVAVVLGTLPKPAPPPDAGAASIPPAAPAER